MAIGNGGIIGKKNTVTTSVASGMFTINEQIKFARTDSWPKVINVSVAPDVTVVNEGGTVTFNVMADGIDNGTTLYWTTNTESGTINTGDFTSGTLSGSFTVAGGVGQITRTIAIDATTPETGEAFSISIRSGSTVGQVLATSVPVTISNATFTIQASATTISEGGVNVLFDITSSGIQNGETIHYGLVSASGTINALDFTESISGTFTTSSNLTSLTFTARNDQLTEGNESFFLQLRHQTSLGAILGVSETVNIDDTSVNPTITFTSLTTNINEGVTNNVSISSSPTYSSAITLYWEVINTTGTLNFSATSGTISGFTSTGSFSVTALTSGLGGSYQIRLRNGGASGSILTTSATVTVNNAAAAVPTTMSLVSSTTSSTQTIAIPGTAQAGDIAFLFDSLNTPSASGSSVVPTGFTSVRSDSSSNLIISTISYKILVSEDIGTNITGMNTSGTTPRVGKVLLIFRPDNPISNAISSTPVGQATISTPTTQTISMAGQTTPLIGFAQYASTNTGLSPRTSSLTMTEVNSNTAHYVKYIVYNDGSTPVSGTVSMPDNGRNTLQSFFIRFS